MGDAMKIYFCDGCNESVPLADVQSGRITTIKGKLFCASCLPPGVVSAPTAAPEAGAGERRGSSPLLVVLVLLLLGWTAWRDGPALLEASQGEPEIEARDPLADMALRLEGMDARLQQMDADARLSSRSLTSMRADLEAVRAADAEQARSTERLADEVDRLARTQADMSRVIEKVQLTESRTAALAGRVDALSESVAAHETALSMPGLGAGAAAGGAAAGGMLGVGGGGGGDDMMAAEPVDPARVALVEETKRLLLDPEPDLRFEGVDRVEEERLDELAPELVGLLSDEDMFVRLHAMNVLGDFDYEPAVPVLFDVLEDGNATVRKAASETLVRLTGYDPGFDHNGSSSERSKVVRSWREWYDAR